MSQRTRSAGGVCARYICDWRASLVGHALACPKASASAASFARMDKQKHVLRQNPDGVVQSAVRQSQCRESRQDPDCPFVSGIHFGAIARQILQ